MAYQTPLKGFLAALLPVFVTAAIPTFAQAQAAAAVSCKLAYAELKKTSVYQETFPEIRGIGRELQNVADLLNRSPEVTSLELMAQVLTFNLQIESYFAKAGISFERHSHSIQIPVIKDARDFSLNYSVYQMKGSRSGDQFSRMMFGVQSNPQLQSQMPKFVFDPFYMINFGRNGMRGHFQPNVKAVVIGPHVLSMDLAGISSIFRHELQHYFESMKIERGEMSLQRLILANPEGKTQKSYGELLSVDEAETHLRDLRVNLNPERRKAIDQKLSSLMEPAILEGIWAERTNLHGIVQKNIGHIVPDSLSVLPTVLRLAKEQRWIEISKDETGRVVVIFEDPAQAYQFISVNIEGMAKKESPAAEISATVVQILNWSQKRLEQIQVELKKYGSEEK